MQSRPDSTDQHHATGCCIQHNAFEGCGTCTSIDASAQETQMKKKKTDIEHDPNVSTASSMVTLQDSEADGF
jgi:hypothetical protein